MRAHRSTVSTANCHRNSHYYGEFSASLRQIAHLALSKPANMRFWGIVRSARCDCTLIHPRSMDHCSIQRSRRIFGSAQEAHQTSKGPPNPDRTIDQRACSAVQPLSLEPYIRRRRS